MSGNHNERPGGEFVLYQTEDGQNRIQCQLVDGTIWLSQMQMGELFQRSKQTISEHLQNIFEEDELREDSVVRNFRTTAADGKDYGHTLRAGSHHRRWHAGCSGFESQNRKAC